MHSSLLRVPVAALALLVLTACNNHSDPTGPDTNYVRVFIQNDSTAPIWAPISYAITPQDSANQIVSGARAELVGVTPASYGGGFAVARPAFQNLAVVNYTFVQPPASKAGLQIVTIHVTANPSAAVIATADRTDLVRISEVVQQ